MTDACKPDAQAIIDVVERMMPAEFINRPIAEYALPGEQSVSLAVVPNGRTIHDLQPFIDKLRPAPKRIIAAASVTTVGSLVDYINRFKIADSAIFAKDDVAAPALAAVIDFHGGAGGGGDDHTPGSDAVPRYGSHTVQYNFPLSDQIRAWSAISGKELGHAEMATFLDDRKYDIANPPLNWMQVDGETVKLLCHLLNIDQDAGDVDDAAPDAQSADEDDDRYVPRSALYKLRAIRWGSAQRLIQMARTVEVSVNSKAVEGYNAKTGERTVVFTDEHSTHDKDGRKIIVPDAFLLRVPVWEGETSLLIPVRLQYRRRAAGALAWFFTLVEWRRVIRFSVRTEAERVQKATDLPLFYGQPKA